MATTMWYQPDLRDKHKRIWDELNYAWVDTFSNDLNAASLELWPESGPYVFNKAQSKWLSDTLLLQELWPSALTINCSAAERTCPTTCSQAQAQHLAQCIKV